MAVKTFECKAPECRAAIIWALTSKGEKLCLDAQPNEKGTFAIDIEPRRFESSKYHAVFVGTSPEYRGKRYMPHKVTCKGRGYFRRRTA